MKLVNASYDIWDIPCNMPAVYDIIEKAARICYKSSGNTSKSFVDKLIQAKHFAMLEHGTIYLKCHVFKQSKLFFKYKRNPFSKVIVKNAIAYITTNYRVIVENNWEEDLKYSCSPSEHERRISVHFTVSIGIARELIRHRVFSFANESTRYCNYSKNKFDNEVTFVIPSWSMLKEGKIYTYYDYIVPKFSYGEDKVWITNDTLLLKAWKESEEAYLNLIHSDFTPQQAREVLPLGVKSELVMTGFISDWKRLFEIRSSEASTGKPHPDMSYIIDKLKDETIFKI